MRHSNGSMIRRRGDYFKEGEARPRQFICWRNYFLRSFSVYASAFRFRYDPNANVALMLYVISGNFIFGSIAGLPLLEEGV